MTAPRSSLRSFLTSAKANLQSAIINQQRVTLVIGNESADLDSITSAIVLAYFRSSSSTSPLTNSSVNKHVPPSQYPPLYIPLLNIPRADVKIRPELLALLPHANIEPSHLITLDDLVAEAPAGLNPAGREELQPKLTRLLLTDQNKLAGPLTEKGFSDCVVGCIDHHVDEKVIPPDTGNEPRIIEVCGSCTSLVVRYCRKAWDSLSGLASGAGRATSGQSDAGVGVDDDAVRRTWDAQIAKFAIASILVDTHNLRDKHKTTDTDRQAVGYLEAKISLAPGGTGATWNRDAFFEEISEAKHDLSKLTFEEILRKDYKQWTPNGKQLGITSTNVTLSYQVDRAGGVEKCKEVIRDFAARRDLDLYCIMASSTTKEGEFQRELLLYSVGQDHNYLVERFTKETTEKLELETWQDKKGLDGSEIDGGEMKVWWQRNLTYSRKLMAPLMRSIIKEA